MLVQALMQLSAVLPLTPQGAVAPPTLPTVANVDLAAEDRLLDGSSLPTPEEFEHICEIRELISGQHRPMADSQLINDSATEFRSTLFSEYDVEAPDVEAPDVEPSPAPAATGSLQADLRQVSERLDAAANRLERRQLYETADELRELSQRLREQSRKQ